MCGGLGMLRYEVPVGHPLFGKLIRCPNNPEEGDGSLQQRLREIGNLTAFADKRFDTFEERPALVHALNITRNFAQKAAGWVLLRGPYGCGKTHLAAAIANERIAAGQTVIFITVPDLLDHLRAAYGPSSEVGYDALFERVRNSGLLVLDDLGVENPSPWAQEKLFQLLNHRHVHRLPTVITTNVDIDTIDPRIRSRLLDTNLVSDVAIEAPDYRTSVQNQQIQLDNQLTLYHAYRFETFETDKDANSDERHRLKRALMVAQEYASAPDGWLTLVGESGTGKTHLAAAIGHARQEMGDGVMFITVADLMDYLRVTFSPGSRVSFDQRFHAVKNVPMLILDALTLDGASVWAQEKLLQLIDFRYVARLPTVITTDQDITRMSSRLDTRINDDRVGTLYWLNVRPYPSRRRGRNMRL